MHTHQRSLSDLFATIFVNTELQRFLHDVDASLGRELAWQAPLAELTFAAAGALVRRNLLDAAFFNRLERERPGRIDDIRRVRRSFVIDAPAVGTIWDAGRLTLLEHLGAGGFATAWKATDNETAEHVTLRILHPQYADDPQKRQRFQRGARTLQRLSHPGLVPLRKADGKEGQWIYCVMDHVDGWDLGTLVAQAQTPMPLLLEILAQIGEALDHVHAHALIHRDVKPGNILVARHSGRGKLIDFDLVSGPNATPLTTTMPLGTLPFAAPEILASHDKPTAAADVYGLAATALHVLSGGQLPRGVPQDPDTLLGHYPRNSTIRKLLASALQLDPLQRTQSTLEFSSGLRTLVGELATTDARVVWVVGSGALPPDPPPVAEFDDDDSLHIWAPTPASFPVALEAEGIRVCPVATVEACASDRRKIPSDVANIVPHFAELKLVATFLALQGHRPAWLGLTATDTPVLVLPDGRVILHEHGLPTDAELAMARRHAPRAGVPAAVVRVLPGGASLAPDIVGLSQEIRRTIHDDTRLRRLTRFPRSSEAAGALELSLREGEGPTFVASYTLSHWANDSPSMAALRGVAGSGRSHQLQRLAAQLAEAALSRYERPVALVRVGGWRPPFRLTAVLRALGHTPRECAALQLAVRSGECFLLLDDVDVPAEPVALPALVEQVETELRAWCGPSGRVLLTLSPACQPASIRVFDLTEKDMTLVVQDFIGDEARWCVVHRAIRERGLFSLLQTPTLTRALLRVIAECDDISPAHLTVALADYLGAWCRLAALHLPHTSANLIDRWLEELAMTLWSQQEGTQQGAIPVATLADLLPEDAIGHSDETLHRLIDQSILSRKSLGAPLILRWLATETTRRTRAPLDPYRSPMARQTRARDMDAAYFVHNSVLEHLLARRVVRRLAAGDVSVLAGPRLTPNICALCRAMATWPDARATILVILRAALRPDISENSLLLALDDAALASAREQPWQLSGARLDGIDLRNARLAGAQLAGAYLADADLRRAVLDGACLAGAMLTRADLRDASLLEVDATGADFHAARLDGARWRGAGLRGATFFASGSLVSPQDLSEVCLDEVDLRATQWCVPTGVPASIVLARTEHLEWLPTTASSHPAVLRGELLSPRSFRTVRDAAWLPDGRSVVSLHASGHLGIWTARPLRPRRWWHIGDTAADRMALAPDGRSLVCWSRGSALRLWDLVAEHEISAATLAELPIQSLAWSYDSSRLALFASDGSLHIWDAATHERKLLATLPRSEHLGRFLPGDTRLLVWSVQTPEVSIWDLASGQKEASLGVTESQAGAALALSPDGRRAVLKMQQHLSFLTLHPELADAGSYTDEPFFSSYAAVDWSPDGRFLALALDNFGPTLWDTVSAQWSHHLLRDAHRTTWLRFSPDSALVLGAGNDAGDLFVWDARTGALLERNAGDEYWVTQVALSPDGRTLVACHGSTPRAWFLPTLEASPLPEFADRSTFTLLPNASGAVVTRDGLLKIVDFRGERRRILDRLERDDDERWDARHVSSDGETFIYSRSDASRVEITGWNHTTGQKVLSRVVDDLRDGPRWRCHTLDARRGIAVSAGNWRGAGRLELWTAGRTLSISVADQSSITQIAIDTVRGVLACVDDQGLVTLWDLDRWATAADEATDDATLRLWTLSLKQSLYVPPLFAPQGGVLAVATGGAVQLIDAETGVPRKVLDARGPRVRSLAFGGDGCLVVGYWSGQIRVWRVATGDCIVTVHVSGDIMARGSRYESPGGEGALAGWYLCADQCCIPIEMFRGTLADREAVARGLAGAFTNPPNDGS